MQMMAMVRSKSFTRVTGTFSGPTSLDVLSSHNVRRLVGFAFIEAI
jgi:hypothetical protein